MIIYWHFLTKLEGGIFVCFAHDVFQALRVKLMHGHYSRNSCWMNELPTRPAGNLNTPLGLLENQQLILKLGLNWQNCNENKYHVDACSIYTWYSITASVLPELSWYLLLNVNILQLFAAQVRRSLILVKLLTLWIIDVCRLSLVLLEQRIYE